jgi:hypothetical protein
MIITQNYNNIQNSENFQKNLFSIGDPSVIFDILRSKLYSDPVAAVCREISCNARDSHIEANKADVPIEIVLPNKLSKSLIIKDFGVGISPDRAENIFIQYGKSTKRNDNTQTGGFGMGCKCPFSITDTFGIVTVFNGIKYSYSAVIDETKVGALFLLNKENTDESNSTQIIIPIKESDFLKVEDSILSITEFWTTKPIIKNCRKEQAKKEVEFNGNNWFLVSKNKTNYSFNNSHVNNIFCLVDKIPYYITIDSLYSILDKSEIYGVQYIGNYALYLEFNTGELSLSASREALYFDENTKNKLKDAIKNFTKEFNTEFSKKISLLPDLYSVLSKHGNDITDYNLLKDVTWNNIKLKSAFNISYYITGNSYIQSKSRIYKSKFSKSLNFSLDKKHIYVNDLYGNLKPSSLKDAFADNDSIFVINLDSKEKEDLFNTKYFLDKYDFKKISSINAKIIKNPDQSKAKKNQIIFNKLDNFKFKRTSLKEFKESKNNIIVDMSEISSEDLENNIIKALSFKYKDKKIWNLKLNEDTIKNLKNLNSDIEFITNDTIKNNIYSEEEHYDLNILMDNYHPLLQVFNSFKNINNNTELYKYKVILDDKVKKYNLKYNNLKNKYNYYANYNEWKKNNPNCTENVFQKIFEKYPLLKHFKQRYSFNNSEINDIKNYMNLIEKIGD